MYRIWYQMYADGELIAAAVVYAGYTRKGNAVRKAKKLFDGEHVGINGEKITYEWIVSETNPWREEEANAK